MGLLLDGPRYKFKGRYLRGDVFECRPYVAGDELKPCFVPITSEPPREGDMLAYNDKGFLAIYLIPRELFERDFEPLAEIGSTA